MKSARKIRLNRETLSRLDAYRTGTTVAGDVSCDQSCYFVSCDGGCTISTGMKD